MAQIIALVNQAGGVGKTTLTMNLGYQLALLSNRVLLIDLDPQSSLTIFMGREPDQIAATVYDSLVLEHPLPILSNIHGLDLCPANIQLSDADLQLVTAIMREFRLKEAIDTVVDEYDFILIDCPPSLGLMSVSALVAATHVLVPVETHFKAFQGTNLLLETLAKVKKKLNRNLLISGFVPTRYDARNSADVRTLAALRDNLSPVARVFAPIPRFTAFVDSTEDRVPLAIFSPKHPAVAILDELAHHFQGVLA